MAGSQNHRGRYQDLFMNFLFIILFLCICVSMSTTATRSPATDSTQQLEVEKLLNQLNKPPLHIIQSPDGDIIHCIHISQQPAFDHPFLKDHKIQMSPSYRPEGIFDENEVSTATESIQRKTTITQLWHMNGRCPEDTIPVRRTKKDDIMRASSVKRFGKKHITFPKNISDDIEDGDHEHAIAYVKGDKYYGARATINVWQPKVQLNNEFSLAQIWVVAGSYDDNLNTVEAGWQVYQHLYGDNNTRLFVYWTSDSYNTTGCYNLLCSGFVQISKDIALGSTISPVSVMNSSQYVLDFLIWKDKGNWWLQIRNDSLVGYWPSSLFTHLSDNASKIQWGGEVLNKEPDGHHTTTQMGSGNFPEEGFGKASYFKKLQVVDESNTYRTPKSIATYAEQSNCYHAQTGSNEDLGQYFLFGGPGLNPNCP